MIVWHRGRHTGQCIRDRAHPSLDFPLLNPLPGAAGDLQGNAFVAKVNPAGTGLLYSTFLGGVIPQWRN